MKICHIIVILSCICVSGVQAVTTLNNHETVSALYGVNIPIDAVPATDKFTTNIFAMIDATFGKSGIGMDVVQIAHLKKTYLYLIFLAKLAQVQKNSSYQQYQTDFAQFLVDNKTALPNIPTAALLTSAGWLNVIVTEQDLQNSAAWQLYLKTMVCDIYVYFSTVLGVIHNVEKQMFNYIPHFETSFYNDDYTSFRTLNEMARTRLVIEESLKKRWTAQVVAWSTLPTIDQVAKTKKQNTITLESEVVAFRATKFYKTIRDAHTTLGINPSQLANSISNEQLLSAPSLQSPLKEQVWCYHMLYEASGQMTSFMTAQNLKQVLQTCATSSPSLSSSPSSPPPSGDPVITNSSTLMPNIFPYTPDDYVLLDELISVQSKVDGTHTNSLNPSPSSYKVDEIIKPEYLSAGYQKYLAGVKQDLATAHQAQVTGQMWSLFKDISHDFSKAYDDVKSAAESGYDAVKDFGIAAGQGIAGIGATAVGFFAKLGGDSTISDWGSAEMKSEEQHFAQATTELSNSINDFANAIKDGIVAPYAEVTGDLYGCILDDQKLGQDISIMVDSVADTLVQVAATAENSYLAVQAETGQNLFQAAQISDQLAVVVGDAAWAIFSDKGREAFLQQGQDLGKECVDAVAQSFSTYFGLAKTGFSSTLVALGVVVNAITTLFIDLSREITYLFTGGIFNALRLNDIPGFTAAQVAGAYGTEQANHVTSVLNAHRSTINMMLGIVGCVVADALVDVMTAGAATGADAEIDFAIMGSVESTSVAASEAAGEAAEALNAAKAAEVASEDAAKNLADLSEDATAAEKEALQKTADELATKAKNLQEIADQAAEKAKTLEKVAQDAANKAADRVATNAAKAAEKAVQDSKGFAQKTSEYVAKSVKAQIKDIQDLSESIPKAFANLGKDNDVILQEAKTALEELPEDAKPAEKQAAQQAVNDAQKIVDETKLGKAARYGKNALKTLGTVLKPVGMVMNVTFNMGSIIGAVNQDAKNALNLLTQSEILNNLWSFNNANKISTAQQQLAYLEEMKQKAQAQVGNQALLLTVSQNTINANILSLRQSMASLFAPLYGQLLTPDAVTNLLLANIGTSWKLQTDYIDLYPSQGFFTTTTGRKDFPFAQEIAQAPDVTNLLLTQAKDKDKLWFNQRCTARDNTTALGGVKNPTDPLMVQVDLQFLYTLNSAFHVGLYLGGNYHDYTAPGYVAQYLVNTTVAQVQNMLAAGNNIAQVNMNPAIVDFDEAHLAKMVVLYRDNATSALMLGVYEHEGLGWILKTPLDANAQLDVQHTYTLQVDLNNTELDIKIFIDGATLASIDQSVQVTPLSNQRTYGLICSGAAIEWNQITPTPVIKSTTRTKVTTMSSELEREQNNKLILAATLAPKFGLFKLTALSKQAILQGQYVYATTQTDLNKILSESPIDFVIFGVEESGKWQLGLNPNVALKNKVNARLVSIINGSVYDSGGNVVGSVENIWSQYKQSASGPFSSRLDTFITQQQDKISLALTKVKFGNLWLLDIASPTALQNGQYLYTCMQTLKDASGQPIIDSTTTKPMIDYLVCAHYTATSLTIGMSPTAQNANALFSFVTGNVYAKNAVIGDTTTVQPLSTGDQGQLYSLCGTYSASYNMVNDPLYTDITNTQASYATYLTSVPTPIVRPAQPIIILPQHHPFHLQFGHRKSPLSAASVEYSSQISTSKHDFGNRQQNAAGTVGYQLYGAKKGIKLSFGHKKSANVAQT